MYLHFTIKGDKKTEHGCFHVENSARASSKANSFACLCYHFPALVPYLLINDVRKWMECPA